MITRLYDRSNFTCTAIRYTAAKATAIPSIFNAEEVIYLFSNIMKFLKYIIVFLSFVYCFDRIVIRGLV